jgi:integrase/recombinase XerD
MTPGESSSGIVSGGSFATPALASDRVSQLVASWLLGFGSVHTRRSYAGDVAGWREFCADHCIDPLMARRPHVDAWARTLQERGLKPSSVGRRLAAVSSWYGFLVIEQVIAATPAEHVRRPKISDEGETPGLTRDELRRLLGAAAEHGSLRSLALLSLLAHTGLRIGEALSRDVEHLAHDRGHRILKLERKGRPRRSNDLDRASRAGARQLPRRPHIGAALHHQD